MKEQVATAILMMAVACSGCETKEKAVDETDDIPIACVLTALNQEQREREDILLKEHLRSVRELKERDDGYSFRYDSDVGLFARMAELVALEHRCCPFLTFELEWGRVDPWLHIRGGTRVKEFVLETFVPKK